MGPTILRLDTRRPFAPTERRSSDAVWWGVFYLATCLNLADRGMEPILDSSVQAKSKPMREVGPQGWVFS